MIPTSRRKRDPTTRSTLRATCGYVQAKCLEVLLADKEQSRVIDGGYRSGITAAIEDRQLRDRTARSIDTEHLFAPAGRALEDAHMSGLDDIKPVQGSPSPKTFSPAA